MNKAFGIIGYSGSGKTTLIERLLPEFARLGKTVNVIKHSHHDLELEPPGKDSGRFRAAGAAGCWWLPPIVLPSCMNCAACLSPRWPSNWPGWRRPI